MLANDQDAFLWSVSDVDAQYSWNFELQGIADAVTKVEIIKLTFSDNGVDIAKKETLFKFGSRDGSVPVAKRDLLFEPGDYLLGLSRAGGNSNKKGILATGSLDLSTSTKTTQAPDTDISDTGEAPLQAQYRLVITKGKNINSRTLSGNSSEQPLKLRPGQSYSFYAENPTTWAVLDVSETASQQRWEVSGATAIGREFIAILEDPDGKKLTQSRMDLSGHFSLPDLGLNNGRYRLKLVAKDANVIRTLSIKAQGLRVEGEESEPNDQWKLANHIDWSKPVKGRAGKNNDKDYFRFTVADEESDLTRSFLLQGDTDKKYEFCLHNESNVAMQCRSAKSTVTLTNLSLVAGDYGLSVGRSKKGAQYTLSMEPAEAKKAIRETEPNDKFPFSSGMNAKRIVKGTFDKADTDYYHFTVSGEPQLWRIQAVGEGISRLALVDASGSTLSQLDVATGVRRARMSNLFLLPGIHHIKVTGKNGSYVLRVLPIGPPNPDFEREPNDDPAHALLIKFGQTRQGLLENHSADDYYRFQLMNHDHIRLTVTPPVDGQIIAKLSADNVHTLRKVSEPGKAVVYEGLFPPGDYSLYLKSKIPSDAEYRIQLERLPRFACAEKCQLPVAVSSRETGIVTQSDKNARKPLASLPDTRANLPVTLKLNFESNRVAAYLRYGQMLSGTLTLTNQSEAGQAVQIETASSDYRWRVWSEKKSIAIPAAGSASVPLTIHVPADAWLDHAVRISVRAYDEKGGQTETFSEIEVEAEAPPMGAVWNWPIDDKLLGGFNVAWQALGARRVPMEKEKKEGDVPGLGRYFHQLFDNQSMTGTGLQLTGGREPSPVAVDVELATDESVDVVGIILNPVGRGPMKRALADFELQLSLDGKTFQTELKGRLQPLFIDQSFPLETAVSARYARLILLSSQDGKKTGGLTLGDWKVIARPGSDITQAKGLNIAAPELGGHVVWARPQASRDRDVTLLTDKQDSRAVSLNAGKAIEWVVGFHNERAARIKALQWTDSDKAKPEQRIKKVKVFTSVEGPVGPWTFLADWDVTENKTLSFTKDKPVWARYVRFLAEGKDKRSQIIYPDTLHIYEQAADKNYRSIIGQWGGSSRDAIYEYLAGIKIPVATNQNANNTSKEQAISLPPGKTVSGKVALARKSDWYRIDIATGQNTLSLDLGGDPTVRTVLSIKDSKGKAVSTRRIHGEFTGQRYKVSVEPGQSYFIKVEEPPRSVAFIWDNSGSVAAYRPMIYNAISTYVNAVTPGIDVANLMVMGGDFLLKNWSGEPYILQSVLNNYNGGANSSDAESALIRATQALSGRAGTRAIVLITDAETGRNDKELWRLFKQVRPRVFTIRVGSTLGVPEDLMQSWANVSDGYYDNPQTASQMGIAFDRARMLLRRPAYYSLTASLNFEETPGPGTLRVVAKNKGLQGGAVELILDASGSMLKRLDGKRRISVAKEVLSNAVTDIIPAGTPLALRVFGHKKANACQTDLEIKLKPLDPKSAKKVISKVNAKNLARTPIADSLAKVESDLRKAKGKKIVILVTDGEETCEGKPQDVLKKLADKGFDIRLNIVGFAIDDAELKSQFENWAEQGGGQYFDAGNESSLKQAVEKALQTPYTVYNQKSEIVAAGTVGGPAVELDAGHYRVKLTSPVAMTFEKIEVFAEQEKLIEYPGYAIK